MISILVLIFCIHSQLIVEISQLLQLSRPTNTFCFSQNISLHFVEMVANISLKCQPTFRILPEMSADIFQNAISNEGGDVVTVRAWKRNVGRHLKHCLDHMILLLWNLSFICETYPEMQKRWYFNNFAPPARRATYTPPPPHKYWKIL